MMRAEVAVAGLVFFVVVSGIVVAVRGRDSPRLAILTVAGLLCLGLFAVLNVLDWPGTLLTTFWTQHAIVSATASTLPLAGAGFFAFKLYDTSVQEDLDVKVAAVGRSGLVDHLVDIDVALSLLPWDNQSIWRRWPQSSRGERPLRWLRENRHLLGREADGQRRDDPRVRQGQVSTWGATQDELVDQALRRLMVGVKEWGPILARSREGEQRLVALGNLRLGLLDLQRPQHSRAVLDASVAALQQSCRRLAWEFDTHRPDHEPRAELIRPDPSWPDLDRSRASTWRKILRQLRLQRGFGSAGLPQVTAGHG